MGERFVTRSAKSYRQSQVSHSCKTRAEQDNWTRGRNTSVGSVRLRIVALASVGCLMSNTTALALRTRYTMYSTNKSSPYSGLLVAMSKYVIWMRYMSNDPVTQWPVRFRQYCPYHDSDYVWASQSSTGSELKRIRDQILIAYLLDSADSMPDVISNSPYTHEYNVSYWGYLIHVLG